MRARFRSIAALLLPAAALFACVLTAQGNTTAPAHQFAGAADSATVVPVPSPNPGDGFSWG
ncbi:hypothetical protein ACFYNY_11815 [Streptomyces sp. NPDC006530]|uniref:hypothetical protein n=1 Tax=Streptomyces sp. NPDC006530 TaxID=3364750 RepID=UPI003679DCC3